MSNIHTICFVLFLKFIYLFIFGCVGCLLLQAGFSLVAGSGGYSSLRCAGFSLQWLLLLQSTGSRHMGFNSCGTQAQQLWLTGLVAPRHVGSSWTRARTHVPCFGRWILNHCATREAQISIPFDSATPHLRIYPADMLAHVWNDIRTRVFIADE